MDVNFDDYEELSNETYLPNTKPKVKPEDEYYHSVYISGQTRTNENGEIEKAGRLQIRGVAINKELVKMIITNYKEVLVKSVDEPKQKNVLKCFSYKNGEPPWTSSTKRTCGKNSAERSQDPFCAPCRSQLIVTGILVDDSNRPVMKDGEFVNVFIRGKGVKYGSVSSYLNDLLKEEFDPILQAKEGQDPEKVRKFEKGQINNKRVITEITIGTQSSAYGMKDVFELKKGTSLSPQAVIKILNIAKDQLPKFKEKFDWSQTKSTSDYGTASKPTADQTFDFTDVKTEDVVTTPPTTKPQETKPSTSYSFDDVNF